MEFMTTITFSEDVTGFDDTDNDVTLGGTAMSGATIGTINPVSARVYEVTITPDINGMKGDLGHIGANANAADRYSGEWQYLASSTSATVELQSERTHSDILHTVISGAQTGPFDVDGYLQ